MLVLFFILLLFTYQAKADILINEIMTEDKDSTKNEFVELYNTCDKPVSLEKYTLKKKTATGNESSLLASSKFFGIIAPHGYFVIAHPDYLAKIKGDLAYSSSLYSIADNNTILLYDPQGNLLDKVGFGTAKDFLVSSAQNPDQIKSIGRIEGKNSGDNGKDFVFVLPTPGEENQIFRETATQKKIYANNLQITELMPNPVEGKDEFIELYNPNEEKVDLAGWSLHDASKAGEYIFPAQIIEPKKYLAIYRTAYKFALNNGGSETVALKNPNNEIVFTVAYNNSKKGASYNYNGIAWHWGSYVTPGQENIFENIPSGQVERDDEVFVNVYANFEIKGLGENAKVVWEFGDGHKSYLQKTRHKYLQEGKYLASVKFSQGSEEVIKNFSVDVQEIAHPKIRIIEIYANPKGTDTGKEYLIIENKSKKKIKLKDWSVATGWKKMINHPIRVQLVIKGGKSKKITSEYASFALNNTKAKIQLRYPDGKVADEIKYQKPEGIAEDEKRVKVKGGWEWKKSVGNNITYHEAALDLANQQASGSKIDSANIELPPIKSQQEIPTKKVEIEILKSKADNKIKLLNAVPKVLGAETVREMPEQYFFTPETQENKHYAILFWENMLAAINEKINIILNLF